MSVSKSCLAFKSEKELSDELLREKFDYFLFQRVQPIGSERLIAVKTGLDISGLMRDLMPSRLVLVKFSSW